MWDTGWREAIWQDINQPWDLIVIGGGITGAGIFREAVRLGLRTLLLEARDFSSGTSSRSSKLVHGGFRYLKNAQIKLTYESVRERERLMSEARGLVNPLGFLITSHRGDSTPGWMYGLGLFAYDILAFKWGHRYYDADDLRELCPPLSNPSLSGGYRYFDAQTDDARLVIRLIREAVRDGGTALNYTPVTGLLRLSTGQVCGVVVEDRSPAADGSPHCRTAEIQASMVISATGAWGDELRQQIGGRERLRKLRGSHLILPSSRLPLTRAVSFTHPRDSRYVFAFPWEGVTLVGTTDVDHARSLNEEPAMSSGEYEYLLEALNHVFQDLELGPQDVQATFSGVRPVVGTGKADPSKESREHVLWCEQGLITVAGGKLTTFRIMALSALNMACAQLKSRVKGPGKNDRVLDSIPPEAALTAPVSRKTRLHLLGRYGTEAGALVEAAPAGELDTVPGTSSLWAELRWAARREAVCHLEDLLLRRVRLGLLLPEGGIPLAGTIRNIVQSELGWDNPRWDLEFANYQHLWETYYRPNPKSNV